MVKIEIFPCLLQPSLILFVGSAYSVCTHPIHFQSTPSQVPTGPTLPAYPICKAHSPCKRSMRNWHRQKKVPKWRDTWYVSIQKHFSWNEAHLLALYSASTQSTTSSIWTFTDITMIYTPKIERTYMSFLFLVYYMLCVHNLNIFVTILYCFKIKPNQWSYLNQLNISVRYVFKIQTTCLASEPRSTLFPTRTIGTS